MTFVTGSGDRHDVRLLDHATVVSGSETTATVLIDISGDENMDGGIDWLLGADGIWIERSGIIINVPHYASALIEGLWCASNAAISGSSCRM